MDNKKEATEQASAETPVTNAGNQPVVEDGELQESDLAKVAGGSAPLSSNRVKTSDKMAKAVDTFIRG